MFLIVYSRAKFDQLETSTKKKNVNTILEIIINKKTLSHKKFE